MSLQSSVGRWGEQTFPHATPQSIVAHLRREVEELAEAVQEGGGGPKNANIREEAADCQLLLFHLAHRFGFNLGVQTREKFAVNLRRQWGDPDAEGVVEHV